MIGSAVSPGRFVQSFDFSREFFLSLGTPGLFAVAFLEFFLLPIPPDLVLIPLSIANPEFALFYAAIATSGSISAGLVGYGIGHVGGQVALQSRFSNDQVEKAEAYFEQYGMVTIAIGAFAPIPEGFELLSIAAGALQIDLKLYLLGSLLGRGGKYFLEAALVLLIGEAVRSLTEAELYMIIGIVTLIILTAYLGRRRWFPNRWREMIE